MQFARTADELKEDLGNQISFLRISSRLYDDGNEAEAIRLATSIRVLVHDTSKSKSLLSQLGRKNILFYNTAPKLDPKNLVSSAGLLMLRSSPEGVKFIPPTNKIPRPWPAKKIPFNLWWENVVIIDKSKNMFTRKDLVLFVANKDGGAHVDPELDENFVNLSRLNSLDWWVEVDGIKSPVQVKPELPCIRQIAYEVLKTLEDEFPEAF